MEIMLVVALCIIGAITWSIIANFIWVRPPTEKEITEKKISFYELLDLIKRSQMEEWKEIKNKLERQWILNDDYDNYYSEWCTITVKWNWYYVN